MVIVTMSVAGKADQSAGMVIALRRVLRRQGGIFTITHGGTFRVKDRKAASLAATTRWDSL